MARHNAAEITAGALVLLVAAGFLAYALAHTTHSTGAGYALTAKFSSIDGLSDGSDVRIAGVKVGSITNTRIDPASYQAVVTLNVGDHLQLPTDTSAEVTSDGLLGGKYLALVPGGAEAMIKPGGQITITQSSVSLEELLGKFIFGVTDLVTTLQKPGGQKPGGQNPDGVGATPGAPVAGKPPTP